MGRNGMAGLLSWSELSVAVDTEVTFRCRNRAFTLKQESGGSPTFFLESRYCASGETATVAVPFIPASITIVAVIV